MIAWHWEDPAKYERDIIRHTEANNDITIVNSSQLLNVHKYAKLSKPGRAFGRDDGGETAGLGAQLGGHLREALALALGDGQLQLRGLARAVGARERTGAPGAAAVDLVHVRLQR